MFTPFADSRRHAGADRDCAHPLGGRRECDGDTLALDSRQRVTGASMEFIAAPNGAGLGMSPWHVIVGVAVVCGIYFIYQFFKD
ncbi:hypothetical protein GCM10009710_06310 [Aeromicrobium alkaliterrae]|uniref:Uncharacterized protein n=1 Tax=Aeromicrobium alkaliterrae TaxID=302168 RepID=A0ABN2JIG6_9ACTN